MNRRTQLLLVLGGIVALIVGADLFVHVMQQPAPAEAGAGASNWDTYLTLLRNIPHWSLEITIEAVTGVLVYPLARAVWGKWHRQHDEEVHGIHTPPRGRCPLCGHPGEHSHRPDPGIVDDRSSWQPGDDWTG